MKAFMYSQPGRGHFRLVVFAAGRKAADQYVKSQHSSRAHRALQFVGNGEPSDPQNWCAAVVGPAK